MKLVSLAITCILGAIAIAAGCRGDERALGLEGMSGARVVASSTAIDPRSLVDLANALRDVETGDQDDAAEGYAAIEESFEGKRFRWQLYMIPAMCRASQCNALPFENGGREQGIVAGWMPRLALSSTQRDKLMTGCGDSPQCPFMVEARLADLIVSTDAFTSLDLDDIELVGEIAGR